MFTGLEAFNSVNFILLIFHSTLEPSKPQNLQTDTAETSGSQLTVTWDSVAESKYEVWLVEKPKEKQIVTATTATFTGLEPLKEYTVKVSAISTCKSSIKSAIASKQFKTGVGSKFSVVTNVYLRPKMHV